METNISVTQKLENWEMSIMNLVWSVCLKWKSILLAGVIFAILLGGLKYYKSYKSYQAELNGSNTIIMDSSNMSRDVQVYEEYVQRFSEILSYNRDSVLLGLDPTGFYKGEISYYINTHFEIEYPIIEKTDLTYGITSAYQGVINKQEVLDQVAEAAGLTGNNVAYAVELIDANNRYGSLNTVSRDLNKGTLTISVYHYDREVCQKILDILEAAIEKEHDVIVSNYGDHSITLNSKNVFFTSDKDLVVFQRDQQDRLRDFANRMSDIRKTLSEEEIMYVDKYEENYKKGVLAKSETEEKITKTVDKPSFSKKWTVLGFLVGVCFAVGLYVVAYLLGTRVRLEDDVENAFGVDVLGVICEQYHKKKGIDGYFQAMLYRRRYLLDKDDALRLLASNIRVLAGKLGKNEIYVIGTLNGEREKEIIKSLTEILQTKEITCIYGNSILYDAESVEKAAKSGVVVVACEIGKTSYNEMATTLDICREQKTRVLGLVMV